MGTETKILHSIVWLDIFHSTIRKELAFLFEYNNIVAFDG
jgi:hypothetical protein